MNAREYWTVLREDRLLIGGIVVVCVAIAAAVALLLPRTYTSTAVFYVASQQTASSSTESYQGAQLSTERVKSYTELITGPRVAADASALLGGTPTADEIPAVAPRWCRDQRFRVRDDSGPPPSAAAARWSRSRLARHPLPKPLPPLPASPLLRLFRCCNA